MYHRQNAEFRDLDDGPLKHDVVIKNMDVVDEDDWKRLSAISHNTTTVLPTCLGQRARVLWTRAGERLKTPGLKPSSVEAEQR